MIPVKKAKCTLIMIPVKKAKCTLIMIPVKKATLEPKGRRFIVTSDRRKLGNVETDSSTL